MVMLTKLVFIANRLIVMVFLFGLYMIVLNESDGTLGRPPKI